MSWDAFEYQFNAFLDANDKVRQLDINESQLTTAEKAQLRRVLAMPRNSGRLSFVSLRDAASVIEVEAHMARLVAVSP